MGCHSAWALEGIHGTFQSFVRVLQELFRVSERLGGCNIGIR